MHSSSLAYLRCLAATSCLRMRQMAKTLSLWPSSVMSSGVAISIAIPTSLEKIFSLFTRTTPFWACCLRALPGVTLTFICRSKCLRIRQFYTWPLPNSSQVSALKLPRRGFDLCSSNLIRRNRISILLNFGSKSVRWASTMSAIYAAHSCCYLELWLCCLPLHAAMSPSCFWLEGQHVSTSLPCARLWEEAAHGLCDSC